ncbi:hypothetical protein SSAG_03424 [Streptomyces sp. Mg1]|nr:hypothetical protein SSAG_03424 [Streptomyces sp. Mg1]
MRLPGAGCSFGGWGGHRHTVGADGAPAFASGGSQCGCAASSRFHSEP